MKIAKKFFVSLLVFALSLVVVLESPACAIQAGASSNYLKKNNIRTTLKKGKNVTVQSACPGIGYRNSKVRIMEFEKEDAEDREGYECAYIKVKISTPKLNSGQVARAVKAANKSGLGNSITATYNAVVIDGKSGLSLGAFTLGTTEVDGVLSACVRSYDSYYEQKAGGYDVAGYKDLIYTIAVCYPKKRKNIYVGIAGTTDLDYMMCQDFEIRNMKFAKTNMYSKKNAKLSSFLKVN